MLSSGIATFLCCPTNNTFAKTILVIFITFTFFLFGLLSVLAWVFFNKNYFTVFNIKLIKRFHGERMALLGMCIVYAYVDKIYNLFYVLPFFDSVFQLLNQRSYLLDLSASYLFTSFSFLLSIYLKSSSFRYVDFLWHNVQTGGFQNLNASSVYCRCCLKHT